MLIPRKLGVRDGLMERGEQEPSFLLLFLFPQIYVLQVTADTSQVH